MRATAPTLAVALAVLALALLTGCSGAASPTGSRLVAPNAAADPEDRSTCEALARADLAVVSADPADLAHSARALEIAEQRAPSGLRPVIGTLARAYRTSAEAAEGDRSRADVVWWFSSRCGGIR